MVKRLLIYALLLNSCYSVSDINKRLEKSTVNFHKEDFPNIEFEKLYILEGIYETKHKFELIYPKLETTSQYYHFIYFSNNGKVSFYTGKSIDEVEFLIAQKPAYFNAMIYKNRDNDIIQRIESFKMGGGYGSYRQYLKVIANKIYIQDGSNCLVYVLAE